ncbi:unnamed protein product [Closterium sp. NIES-54]
MPDELFDKLAEALVFSTLDLRQGFNQIPYGGSRQEKDGLSWARWAVQVEYLAIWPEVSLPRVPAGHGSECEHDLPPGKVQVWAENYRELYSLGFEVEGGEIEIQKAKVEVLDRVATPKDRSTLRALLGFLNYYRKFVPNFSSWATALNHLLREDRKWELGPEQEKAVQDLMGAVKNGVVLELPKADLPFTLYANWSSAGMGAVLAQMKGEVEKVVAFASHSCNAAEANYSSYEGEGLAVVWAVKHFRVYLHGRKFTLVTDHQPLLWLVQMPDLTGCNARWAMKLQEYAFEIKHRPGKTMQHVDGLSRNLPEVHPTSCYHPQRGLAERLVQTVKKGLRAYGEEHKRDLDRKLCWVMAGYRFSKQAALRDVLPYYLLFSKEPVMPVGAPRLLLDVVTTCSAEKWVAVTDAQAAYLRHFLPATMENLHVAQLRDIERYKQRQEAGGKGARVGVQEEEEVYLRRQRKHALDVGLS